MVPNEKMSERWSTSFPRTCSGDMYPTVPITVPDSVPRATVGSEPEVSFVSVILARPKSKIFTRPWLVRNMFSGFRSRCTIPFHAALPIRVRSARHNRLSCQMAPDRVLAAHAGSRLRVTLKPETTLRPVSPSDKPQECWDDSVRPQLALPVQSDANVQGST